MFRRNISPPSLGLYFLPAGFLLILLFDPKNGGGMFLRNVGWLSADYMAIYLQLRDTDYFSLTWHISMKILNKYFSIEISKKLVYWKWNYEKKNVRVKAYKYERTQQTHNMDKHLRAKFQYDRIFSLEMCTLIALWQNWLCGDRTYLLRLRIDSIIRFRHWSLF
jgi:hypothetical protein